MAPSDGLWMIWDPLEAKRSAVTIRAGERWRDHSVSLSYMLKRVLQV
jgi:hypothetical protein